MKRCAFLVLLAVGCGSSNDPTTSADDATSETPSDEAGDALALEAADDTAAPEDAADSGAEDSAMPTDIGVPTDTATTMDTTAVEAGCPAPTGILSVAPTGSDATGNGSAACPFKTITKALQRADTLATSIIIELQSGAGTAVVTYGDSCTGGAPCDALPVYVSSSVNKGLVIRGASSDPARTRILGGTYAVVQVAAPNVGIANLTIAPRKVAVVTGGSSTTGAGGIIFSAPKGVSEASVTNVVIDGIVKTAASGPTGDGITIDNGTSPTIGPGVTIVGGAHGVIVRRSSRPTITSSAAAPTFIHSTQSACVMVQEGSAPVPSAVLTSTSTTDPGRLHLQDCGVLGGVYVSTGVAGVAVTVNRTLIDTSAPTVNNMNFGIVATSAAVVSTADFTTVTGMNLTPAKGSGAAVAVDTNASFTAGPGLVVTRNQGVGLRFSDAATAVLDGVVSTMNGSDGGGHGLGCLGSSALGISIRNSTFLQNFASGLSIGGTCKVDLGSGLAGGNNVFSRTSKKNGATAICYTSSIPATATGSTWSCGLAATAACTAATAGTKPVLDTTPSCIGSGDYGLGGTGALTVPFAGQTCCGL